MYFKIVLRLLVCWSVGRFLNKDFISKSQNFLYFFFKVRGVRGEIYKKGEPASLG